jgi:hypothetical protein
MPLRVTSYELDMLRFGEFTFISLVTRVLYPYIVGAIAGLGRGWKTGGREAIH